MSFRGQRTFCSPSLLFSISLSLSLSLSLSILQALPFQADFYYKYVYFNAKCKKLLSFSTELVLQAAAKGKLKNLGQNKQTAKTALETFLPS